MALAWLKKSMVFFVLALLTGCAADAPGVSAQLSPSPGPSQGTVPPAASQDGPGTDEDVVLNSLPGDLPTEPVQDARIVIYKQKRRLVLFSGDAAVASFPVGLGFAPVGHKQREGDGKTPEGEYYVCTRNDKSKYHLSLGLSYPNAGDARAAYDGGKIDEATCNAIVDAIEQKMAPPWDTPLGGGIMLHGGGATDWTAGCIAVEDSVMDQLWPHCPLGTPVTILP